jgi:hypothetical protein
MVRRLRPEEQACEELEGEEEPRAAPAPGYRIAADVQVRAFELEQELRETKAKIRAYEREVFAARRIVRRRRAVTALSRGGLGAAIGATIGLALHWSELLHVPEAPALCTLVAFVFGALLGMRWDPPDDDFPNAPPPKLHY